LATKKNQKTESFAKYLLKTDPIDPLPMICCKSSSQSKDCNEPETQKKSMSNFPISTASFTSSSSTLFQLTASRPISLSSLKHPASLIKDGKYSLFSLSWLQKLFEGILENLTL
jgi:hypothetical protein